MHSDVDYFQKEEVLQPIMVLRPQSSLDQRARNIQQMARRPVTQTNFFDTALSLKTSQEVKRPKRVNSSLGATINQSRPKTVEKRKTRNVSFGLGP